MYLTFRAFRNSKIEVLSDLEIVYQDAYMVAVNKPAGWLVHRSKIDRRAQFVALQQLRDQVGKHVYPVHRLDKPTSGVLLFGLSSEAANRLMTLFAERKNEKTIRSRGSWIC